MSNQQTVQDIYAAFGRGDIPAILERLADDVRWDHLPDGGGAERHGVPWLVARTGRDDVAGFFEALGGARDPRARADRDPRRRRHRRRAARRGRHGPRDGRALPRRHRARVDVRPRRPRRRVPPHRRHRQARRGVRRPRGRVEAYVVSGVTAGALPSQCHRIRHATVRYGRHGSPSAVSSAGVGMRVEPVGALDRAPDPEVADREHVRALELEHEEHVRAPLADALHGDELGDDLVVGQVVEALELELAGDHVLGERAQERRLRPREPGREAHLVGVGREDLLGRGRVAAEVLEQPAVDRRARRRPRAAGRRSSARARRSGRPARGGTGRAAGRAARARRAGGRGPGRRRAGARARRRGPAPAVT